MKEKISELMDGELEARAAADTIDTLGREGDALDTWRCYQVISDAMRDTQLLSPGFAVRLAEKLAAEPTVLAPKRVPLGLRAEPGKWFALPAAAAASFAGVALVGWLAFAPQQQGAPSPESLAQAPVLSPTREAKPAMVPLPSATPDYLLAHQGFSPRVSLQGMAPYARTVSDQANESRK
jgi:sigma-E factor negative regulatory protein RseA